MKALPGVGVIHFRSLRLSYRWYAYEESRANYISLCSGLRGRLLEYVYSFQPK